LCRAVNGKEGLIAGGILLKPVIRSRGKICLLINKFGCSINRMPSHMTVTVLMGNGNIEVKSSFIS
jgi:hypothetical protein